MLCCCAGRRLHRGDGGVRRSDRRRGSSNETERTGERQEENGRRREAEKGRKNEKEGQRLRGREGGGRARGGGVVRRSRRRRGGKVNAPQGNATPRQAIQSLRQSAFYRTLRLRRCPVYVHRVSPLRFFLSFLLSSCSSVDPLLLPLLHLLARVGGLYLVTSPPRYDVLSASSFFSLLSTFFFRRRSYSSTLIVLRKKRGLYDSRGCTLVGDINCN